MTADRLHYIATIAAATDLLRQAGSRGGMPSRLHCGRRRSTSTLSVRLVTVRRRDNALRMLDCSGAAFGGRAHRRTAAAAAAAAVL